MESQSKLTGNLGEDLALRYLRQKGYNLVQKNYHILGGEIDLILKKNSILVFVEVKTRKSKAFGLPEEALNNRKKRKLLRAICKFLNENPFTKEWRCDLIAIQFTSQKRAEIKHIINIFKD